MLVSLATARIFSGHSHMAITTQLITTIHQQYASITHKDIKQGQTMKKGEFGNDFDAELSYLVDSAKSLSHIEDISDFTTQQMALNNELNKFMKKWQPHKDIKESFMKVNTAIVEAGDKVLSNMQSSNNAPDTSISPPTPSQLSSQEFNDFVFFEVQPKMVSYFTLDRSGKASFHQNLHRAHELIEQYEFTAKVENIDDREIEKTKASMQEVLNIIQDKLAISSTMVESMQQETKRAAKKNTPAAETRSRRGSVIQSWIKRVTSRSSSVARTPDSQAESGVHNMSDLSREDAKITIEEKLSHCTAMLAACHVEENTEQREHYATRIQHAIQGLDQTIKEYADTYADKSHAEHDVKEWSRRLNDLETNFEKINPQADYDADHSNLKP